MPSMMLIAPGGAVSALWAQSSMSTAFGQWATSAGFAFSAAYAASTGGGGSVVFSSITVSGALRVSFFGLGLRPVARQAAIADPVGGLASDPQARAALSAILSALRTLGLISTA